jgi:diaminopropionate ammonia-lyase
VQSPERFLLNPNFRSIAPVEAKPSTDVLEFHRSLPDYAPTPLVSVPQIAEAVGVGHVLVKDESMRLGLPAFKMLGASWAVHRALASQESGAPTPRLVTATDGNHGRAVARMAAWLGLDATILVPRGVSDAAIEFIRTEGAEVRVLDADYDETVMEAARLADSIDEGLLIQDTSWPGYEIVPQWIVDGYATLFNEAAEQAEQSGLTIDVVLVPAGVGSLAHAAVAFGRSQSRCQVISVEPTVAACVCESLRHGELTSVVTGETVMAGLNCGTPSYLAWPDLRSGLTAATTVDDEQATAATAQLASLGVDSGPCGGASLAALKLIAQEPARTELGLHRQSTVLLINTEGASSTR